MKQMPPISQLFVTVGLVFLHILLFSGLSIAICTTLFGLSLTDLSGGTNLESEASLNGLMITQMLTSFGMFFMAAYVAAKLFSDNPNKYLFIDKIENKKLLILTSAIAFVVLPVISFLGVLNTWIPFPDALESVRVSLEAVEEASYEIIGAFLSREGVLYLILNLLMIAVIPAIGEEFLFRGVIQRLLVKWTSNVHAGIWITAILFSLLHGSYFGFIPRMFLGAMFGYMLVWSKSLWLPVLAHFINNGFVVMLSYFYGAEAINEDVETFGATEDWLLVAGSIIVSTGLFYLFYKWRNQDGNPYDSDEENLEHPEVLDY